MCLFLLEITVATQILHLSILGNGGDSVSQVFPEIVVTMVKKVHYFYATLPSVLLLCLWVTDFSLDLLVEKLVPNTDQTADHICNFMTANTHAEENHSYLIIL